MTRNQKPVVFVAIALCAVMIIPLFILVLSRIAGDSNISAGIVVPSPDAEVIDFDLQQLAEQVEAMLKNDLTTALREGDVSLEWMAALNRDAEKARAALAAGKPERAESLYRSVLQTAQAQMEALALADKARVLNETTYAELKRLEYLKAAFANTYDEAVTTYNRALRFLTEKQYQKSVDDYEMTGAILGDLEARALQQLAGLLESGKTALEAYELGAARSAFQEVLRIDPANVDATQGLVMVHALEGIADQVQAIQALEDAGEFEAALKQLELLAANDPNNPFLNNQREAILARIQERDYQALLQESIAAEANDDFPLAIETLEAALALKSTGEQEQRLLALKEKQAEARMEQLLASGFEALKLGRYEEARRIYKEATVLSPASKEARTGLEKASSLYLANIRYTQNLNNAAKYIKEGRFPLAAKFFNDAMSSRPNTVAAAHQKEENRLRDILEVQSQEVVVTVESDNRTFVSITGVLPPDRIKEKELKLFPDVYLVKGTRPGYETLEIELKVDATQKNQTIVVECTQKL